MIIPKGLTKLLAGDSLLIFTREEDSQKIIDFFRGSIMRLTYIFTSLALVLRCIALVILAPAAVAVYYKDWHSIIPFVGASLLSFVLSFLLQENQIHLKA